MKKTTKTIKIVCVSDCFGSEIETGPMDEVSLEEAVQVEHEGGEECDSGDCSCSDHSNMVSLYEVPVKAWEGREETGFNDAHSSFWLGKYGEELCVGDFV